MVSENVLTEIRNDILREVYDEAEPGFDFDDLLENQDDYPDDWYSQHELPAEREREILNKHLDKHDLNEGERSTLTTECILNLGPKNPTEQ